MEILLRLKDCDKGLLCLKIKKFLNISIEEL